MDTKYPDVQVGDTVDLRGTVVRTGISKRNGKRWVEVVFEVGSIEEKGVEIYRFGEKDIIRVYPDRSQRSFL